MKLEIESFRQAQLVKDKQALLQDRTQLTLANASLSRDIFTFRFQLIANNAITIKTKPRQPRRLPTSECDHLSVHASSKDRPLFYAVHTELTAPIRTFLSSLSQHWTGPKTHFRRFPSNFGFYWMASLRAYGFPCRFKILHTHELHQHTPQKRGHFRIRMGEPEAQFPHDSEGCAQRAESRKHRLEQVRPDSS